MIRMLFFGPIAEAVATRQMQIDFQQGFLLQDVISLLTIHHPKVFEIICFIAVNDVQIRDMQHVLNDNDEIAFMAKYSGG